MSIPFVFSWAFTISDLENHKVFEVFEKNAGWEADKNKVPLRINAGANAMDWSKQEECQKGGL
jgi:hypothetical protein